MDGFGTGYRKTEMFIMIWVPPFKNRKMMAEMCWTCLYFANRHGEPVCLAGHPFTEDCEYHKEVST